MLSTGVISVGIDVGTSTTQLAFSRLTLENIADCFSVPRISVTQKEIFYRSPVEFTPLREQNILNGTALADIVRKSYRNAGISAADIHMGAVIITGDASRKENARIVTESLSGLAGEFVVALAGSDLEAVIAGKGSGAYRYASENQASIINMDIGGGTTNMVFFNGAEIVGTACLDIGGRQIMLDKEERVTYVSESAKKIAAEQQLVIPIGRKAVASELKQICRRMAELLEEAAGMRQKSQLLGMVRTKGSKGFGFDEKAQVLSFSGGVADCMAQEEEDPFRYGDIGPLLGQAIKGRESFQQVKVITATETIGATVVGAGSYSTSISGSTIAHRGDLLPLKNIPVMKLSSMEQERCMEGDSDFLAERINWFLAQSSSTLVALAMKGDANLSYRRLHCLAGAISEAYLRTLGECCPLLLIVESDIAMALGRAVQKLVGPDRCVVAIDNISVEQGDCLDLGKPLLDGMVIPVVVKTLVFG